jgi:DNA-binding transcriptional regulator GbsR (MarR family)
MGDNQQKLMFVEDVGLMFEHWGLPRMAGRVLGWLLVCDPPSQSFGEITEALQASKGSISSATRMLIAMGLIERTAQPGDRRDFFRIRPNAWADVLRIKLEGIAIFRQLAERGLQLLDDESPENRQRLLEMHALYTFFEGELPLLFKRWQQQ